MPDDWVYVNNFAQPHKPNAIRLPPPAGPASSARDIEKVLEDLQAAITQAFEGEEYEKQRREIAQRVSEQQEAKLDALREEAENDGFTMVRTPAGLAFAPKTPEGETMSRDQYNAPAEDEQKRVDDGLSDLNEQLQQVMRQVRQDEKTGRERLRQLDQEVSTYAAQHLVDDLREKWAPVPEVVRLPGRRSSRTSSRTPTTSRSPTTSRHPASWASPSRASSAARPPSASTRSTSWSTTRASTAPRSSRRSTPSLPELVGRVEHLAQFGALVTDFNMIKPGALHAANGGFLVVEARDLLTKPYAWDALKRCLKTAEVSIEDLATSMGYAPRRDPGPGADTPRRQDRAHRRADDLLPALPGRPRLRGAVQGQGRLRHRADRTPENELLYAKFVADVVPHRAAPPFTAAGVARVVEHGSAHARRPDEALHRLPGDQRPGARGRVLGRAAQRGQRPRGRRRRRRTARDRPPRLSLQPHRGARARDDHRRRDAHRHGRARWSARSTASRSRGWATTRSASPAASPPRTASATAR